MLYITTNMLYNLSITKQGDTEMQTLTRAEETMIAAQRERVAKAKAKFDAFTRNLETAHRNLSDEFTTEWRYEGDMRNLDRLEEGLEEARRVLNIERGKLARLESASSPFGVKSFGCCKCQCFHVEGEELFTAHIMHQDKHGIQRR